MSDEHDLELLLLCLWYAGQYSHDPSVVTFYREEHLSELQYLPSSCDLVYTGQSSHELDAVILYLELQAIGTHALPLVDDFVPYGQTSHVPSGFTF